MITLGSMLSQAGWTMVPLYVCSVVALGVTVAKALHFWTGRVGSVRALELLDGPIEPVDALQERLDDETSPLGRVLAGTLRTARARPQDTRDKAVRLAMAELEDYDSWLPVLAYVAQVAPLFGLLGTVLGMVDLFSSMQIAGDAISTTTLSAGIWKALLTTAAGLTIAIPTIGAHLWLVRRLETLKQRMERGVGALLEVVGQ